MPSEQTAEQLEIRRRGRQRLIGAIALALLAVVFVPMLLDPEPRRDRAEPLLAIPPREGVAPLPPSPAPSPAQASGTVGPANEPVGKTPTAAKAPVPDATPATTATAAPAPPPAAAKRVEAMPSAPALEGFAVQVGAFKDEARLQRSREKLVAAGLPHYLERQAGLTRLRAGPFPTREAAQKAQASLKRSGIEGRIVSLP